MLNKLIMNRLILILTCFFAYYASAQDYMEKIAEGTCDCIAKKKLNLNNDEQLKLNLGLCMMEAYGKYEKLVPKKDRLDLSNSAQMRAFGEKLGIKMISFCPDFLMAVGKQALKDDAIEEDSTAVSVDEAIALEDLSVEGTIHSITKNHYLILTVKESTGKSHQFYLINNFENSYLITDQVLQNKDKVKVSYFETELYDVQLNKFLISKVITDIVKL